MQPAQACPAVLEAGRGKLRGPGHMPPFGLQGGCEESTCVTGLLRASARSQAEPPCCQNDAAHIVSGFQRLEFEDVAVVRGEGENCSGESTCFERCLLRNQKPAEQGDNCSCRFPLQLPNLFKTDASGNGCANPPFDSSSRQAAGGYIFFLESLIFITSLFFSPSVKARIFPSHP